MKTKLLFVALVMCLIFCCSGCDVSSGPSPDSADKKRISELEILISNLNCELEELNRELEELNRELEKTKLERDNVEKKARNRYIVLSVIAYTALGVGLLLIGGFIFLATKSNKNITKGTVDNTHCPRCGWECAPGETICKNCKTHF